MDTERGAQQGNTAPDEYLEELSLRSPEAEGIPADLADLGIPTIDVTHVAEDARTASEDSLQKVAATCATKGTPIRMRLPIQLWDGNQYLSWRGEIWKVEAADADEAREIREALTEFFDQLGRRGASGVRELLKREDQK